MNRAELCPVCNGKGIVPNLDLKCCGKMVKCHGCDGKGWIVVPQPPIIAPEKPYAH